MTTWLPVANLTTTMQALHDDDLAHVTEAALGTLLLMDRSVQRVAYPVLMAWSGYPGGLWSYFLQACQERIRRGEDVVEYVQQARRDTEGLDLRPIMPRWFGYRAVHLSHASNLMRERPTYYARLWPTVPLDMPMLWPVNTDGHFDFSIRIRRVERALITTGARVLPIAGEFHGRIEQWT